MSSLAIATEIKNALLAAPNDEVHQPVEEWFVDTGNGKNRISYQSIAFEADKEYENWKTLDPRITWSANLRQQLTEWIRDVPAQELTDRIDETLDGVDGNARNPTFQFTKFQRLQTAFWIDHPFDRQAIAAIEVEQLRDMASYAPSESRRSSGMHSHFAMLQGSCPNITILDTPTAGGKTACAISMAMLLLSPRRFEQLKERARNRHVGVIFQGSCQLNIARLCIVAAGGTTYHHFEDTLTRMIPVFMRKYEGYRIVLWTNTGSRVSVQAALDACSDGRTIVFWCIPVGETNKVLRQNPDIVVACFITDEYVDAPRERSASSKSEVCNHIVTQATPQALVQATTGMRSWLKEAFGGSLHAPRSIHRLIRNRNFSEAQLALNQACKLELMTLYGFRDLIRNDLRPLVPNGLDVHFIRSRTLTAAAFLMRSRVDVVPANFANVLLSMLRSLRLTDESIRAVQSISSRHVSVDDLINVVRDMRSTDASVDAATHPSVCRLVDRLREITVQCPVCMREDACASNDVMMFGCCGYCVCQSCFSNLSRCPFCRTGVPTMLNRVDVPQPTAEVIEIVDTDDEDEVTSCFPSAPRFTSGSTIDDDLSRFTSSSKTQVDNVVTVMHILMRHDYNRVIILFEQNNSQMLSADMENYFSPRAVSRRTGFDIHLVNKTFSGRGSAFKKIKEKFDDPNHPRPVALLCYGIEPTFLYGTDLGKANAVVCIGDIDSTVLTQATGRTMRPLQGRDPSIPIKMFRIYSGDHNYRRRPRPREE
jgi:hypothetical protein